MKAEQPAEQPRIRSARNSGGTKRRKPAPHLDFRRNSKRNRPETVAVPFHHPLRRWNDGTGGTKWIRRPVMPREKPMTEAVPRPNHVRYEP